jgi:cell division protein FtsB
LSSAIADLEMMAEAAPPNGLNDDAALAEKSELQILQEENAVMRREIEALVQAKEIAREKVRVSSNPPPRFD